VRQLRPRQLRPELARDARHRQLWTEPGLFSLHGAFLMMGSGALMGLVAALRFVSSGRLIAPAALGATSAVFRARRGVPRFRMTLLRAGSPDQSHAPPFRGSLRQAGHHASGRPDTVDLVFPAGCQIQAAGTLRAFRDGFLADRSREAVSSHRGTSNPRIGRGSCDGSSSRS
jgi:hypothetical protein